MATATRGAHRARTPADFARYERQIAALGRSLDRMSREHWL
jgi:hypothetical protein